MTQRFPNPEFKKDYQLPTDVLGEMDLATNPTIALVVLIVVLASTVYLLFYKRSRKSLRPLIIGSLIYFGFYHKGCICSVGSIQNMAEALFNSNRILPYTVMGAFLLPLIGALFWGRIFCVAACPLGAIQELVIYKPVRVPPLLNRGLKLIPHIYLGLAALFAINDLGFIICEYDPFVGFFRFSATLPMFLFGAGLLLLGTFVARPYCRYICPYSVLLRLCAKLSPRRVETTPTSCINCHLCHSSCPVDSITPPTPIKQAPKKKSLIYLQWLLAASPAILAIGLGWGALLSEPIASLHPDVRLYQEMKENKTSDYVTAFLIQGGSKEEITNRMKAAKKSIRNGSLIFGAYLALVFMLTLFVTLRKRMNKNYEVDVGECISCGVCYQYCPREAEK